MMPITIYCNQMDMNLFSSFNGANHYLLQSNEDEIIQFNECRPISIHHKQIYINLLSSIYVA